MSTRFFASLVVLSLMVSACWAAALRKSPDLRIDMVDGSKILVTQYHGKVVVFAAIMTTCPHCQAATRTLASLQQEYGPKGLQVLEAAIDQQPQEPVRKFIADFNPPFPVGFMNYLALAQYMDLDPNKRFTVPCITFIDREGMIRGQYTGSDPFNTEASQAQNLRTTIQKLLARK